MMSNRLGLVLLPAVICDTLLPTLGFRNGRSILSRKR